MSQIANKINAAVEKESPFIQNVINEIQTVIVGQQYVLERLLIGVLAEGHILLEAWACKNFNHKNIG